MFSHIECPNPAYRRIAGSELFERILRKKENIHEIFLYDSIYTGDGEGIVKKAREEIGNSPEQRQVFDEICDLAFKFDSGDEDEFRHEGFEKKMIENPAFLAYLALGEDVFQFERFGFPTRRSLEESVASFCIGERHLFKDYEDCRVWRNGDFKNKIHLNEHGDLYACQKDVSGRERAFQGLFGRVVEFDCIKHIEDFPAVYSYQDWSGFLISLLKYAEVIGKKNMPEIAEWKRVLSEVGARGTNTAECMFGGGGGWWIDLMVDETPILTEGKTPETFPLSLPCRELTIVPYVSNGRLVYLTESKDRGESVPEFKGTRYENRRFIRGISYDEKDLPDALKASYRFFARDRTLLPKIMDRFIARK